MLSARETALRALISFRRESAWPDLYLKKACADMRAEEAALTSAITYGVLQNRAYLDFLLARVSARPLEKITPQALDAVWEEEQVKFFADKGCGDSAITAHQRRFAGAVAPQYLNITTGGQH